MIPTLTPAQGAWLTAHASMRSCVLSPEECANLGARRGLLVRRGGMSVLLAQDLQRRWILGGRPHAAPERWFWLHTRPFPAVEVALWPPEDHALLLCGEDKGQPAHQRLAATALAQALGYRSDPPWPTLIALGAPGALLLLGVPIARTTGFLLEPPLNDSPLPPLLAVLPAP